jgi:hypothetical protein
MRNTLKPNGISHTAMPTNKPSDYNAWMRHITKTTVVPYRWQIHARNGLHTIPGLLHGKG